jgi:DNA-binding Lrp family transcriptional regulator
MSWEELAHNLSGIEGVVSVFAVSGDVDLMLEIIAQDMQHYSQIVLKKCPLFWGSITKPSRPNLQVTRSNDRPEQ